MLKFFVLFVLIICFCLFLFKDIVKNKRQNNFILFVIATVISFVALSCGGMPYSTCNVANTMSCVDRDNDGTNETIAVCDGNNWVPTMDCSSIFDPNGKTIELSCVSDNIRTYCE